MPSHIRAVVLDIEGTVCPISFVHDVLFPFAVRKVHHLVSQLPQTTFPLTADSAKSSDALVSEYLTAFPAEYTTSSQTLLNHIDDLVARDVKAPYLKSLQGYLWKSGYESGEITAPVYPDAIAAITRWSASRDVYIYSSGSVPAQILLFAHVHTANGSKDLTALLKGYFDTVNAGQKTVKDSYDSIAHHITVDDPSSILFFTDNPKEIDAAQAAGWKTVLVVRPGNSPFDDSYRTRTPVVDNFDSVDELL